MNGTIVSRKADPDYLDFYFVFLFFRGNFEPGFGTVQGVERTLDVDRSIAAGQQLFGTLFGFLSARHINFGRAFRRLRQDRHFVGQHFRESPGHGQTEFVGVFTILDLANCLFSDQGRMPWQDTKISVLPGNLNFLSRGIHDFLFRGHDLEFESIGHNETASGSWLPASNAGSRKPDARSYAAAFIFSAASSTSSIGPFI